MASCASSRSVSGKDSPSLTAADGLVFLFGADGVEAWDGTIDNFLWSSTAADGGPSPFPTLAWSTAGLFVYNGWQLFNLDPLNGSTRWVATMPSSNFASMVTTASGQVLVDQGGTDEIVSASTGALLAQSANSAVSAYGGSQRFSIFNNALDAIANNTQLTNWTFSGNGQLVGMPLTIGAHVYVTAANGVVYELDQRSETVLNTALTASPVSSCASCDQPPSMATDGTNLYVPTEAGLDAFLLK